MKGAIVPHELELVLAMVLIKMPVPTWTSEPYAPYRVTAAPFTKVLAQDLLGTPE